MFVPRDRTSERLAVSSKVDDEGDRGKRGRETGMKDH